MLNKNLLAKKLPYVDQFTSNEEAINYIVKVLNSTFRDTIPEAEEDAECVCEIPGETPIILDGEILVGPWATISSPTSFNIVINHSLGVVPSGWILIDSTRQDPNGGVFSIHRASWTSTQITFTIITSNTGTTQGEIKFILLR